MSGKCFVDTNVLVYAHDSGAGDRHLVARDLVSRLWDARTGVLSTQVLQELYVNVRRKAAHPMTPATARELIQDYVRWETVVNDGKSVLAAIALQELFQLSFWDALILQAANASGARILYSEDLSHDRVYANVRVVNPFAENNGA